MLGFVGQEPPAFLGYGGGARNEGVSGVPRQVRVLFERERLFFLRVRPQFRSSQIQRTLFFSDKMMVAVLMLSVGLLIAKIPPRLLRLLSFFRIGRGIEESKVVSLLEVFGLAEAILVPPISQGFAPHHLQSPSYVFLLLANPIHVDYNNIHLR